MNGLQVWLLALSNENVRERMWGVCFRFAWM